MKRYNKEVNEYYHEISYRAKNNCGNYTTKEEAMDCIRTAIDEVTDNLNQRLNHYLAKGEFDELISEMIDY